MTAVAISVEDRLEVLDLLARYCRALDGRLREEFLDSFWDDAVLDSSVVGGEHVGRDQIAEWWERLHTDEAFAPFLDGQHRPANVIFDEATADRATVWSQFELITSRGGPPRISAYGEYHDVVVKRCGEWRFARRFILTTAGA